MSKFIFRVSDLLAKECRIVMLVKDMNISKLMAYVEETEGEKLKERNIRESKRA